MSISPKEEDSLVRWLFAEAITYRNRGRPIRNRFALKWASHTRVHKILFSVFERFDIPVTRSWYMWGGFVHSDVLQGPSFTSLRYDYSKHPERAVNLRRKIQRKLDIPVNKILEILYKYTDEVQSMPSRDFLLYYYETEVPEEYRNIYVSKQEVANHLHALWNLEFKNVLLLKRHIDRLRDDISDFHESSLTFFDDPHLEDLNVRFADIVETSLDKMFLLIEEEKRISKSKILFFKKAENTFNYFIWNPYACKISQRTIKGLRADEERKKMKFIEKRTIECGPEELKSLRQEMEKNGLVFSWEEFKRFKKLVLKGEETAKVVSEILNIYSRGSDEE